MTTDNNEQHQNETGKQKIGCGTIILIAVVFIGAFFYFYISGLANGFSNS